MWQSIPLKSKSRSMSKNLDLINSHLFTTIYVWELKKHLWLSWIKIQIQNSNQPIFLLSEFGFGSFNLWIQVQLNQGKIAWVWMWGESKSSIIWAAIEHFNQWCVNPNPELDLHITVWNTLRLLRWYPASIKTSITIHHYYQTGPLNRELSSMPATMKGTQYAHKFYTLAESSCFECHSCWSPDSLMFII